MSYLGYRVKIGDTIIKNTMIAPETYDFTKQERVISIWKDANRIDHKDMAESLKTKISFSIRERTMSEQADIAPIFATLKNLTVEYWDDIAGDYATGTFFMDPPIIKSVRFGAELIYRETAVTLTEY